MGCIETTTRVYSFIPRYPRTSTPAIFLWVRSDLNPLGRCTGFKVEGISLLDFRSSRWTSNAIYDQALLILAFHVTLHSETKYLIATCFIYAIVYQNGTPNRD